MVNSELYRVRKELSKCDKNEVVDLVCFFDGGMQAWKGKAEGLLKCVDTIIREDECADALSKIISGGNSNG